MQGGAACIQQGAAFRCCIRPFFVPVTFELKVEEEVLLKKVVWRGEKFGIPALHEYLFEEAEGGVRVTSREVFTGSAVTVSGRLFPKGEIGELTERFLEELKTAAERTDG